MVVRISGTFVLLIVGIAENLGILSVKRMPVCASDGCPSDFGVHEHNEPSVFDEPPVFDELAVFNEL